LDKDKKQSIFKRQNWFFSAALVGGLYVVMVIFIYRFRVEASGVENFIHLLPLLSVLMVGVGILDKRKKEEDDAVRKKAKYEMTKELMKAERLKNK
jgi:hypothetical protein